MTGIPRTPPPLDGLMGCNKSGTILMALILFVKEERHLTGRKVVFSPENNEFFLLRIRCPSHTLKKLYPFFTVYKTKLLVGL
jgi:hypothetical protein